MEGSFNVNTKCTIDLVYLVLMTVDIKMRELFIWKKVLVGQCVPGSVLVGTYCTSCSSLNCVKWWFMFFRKAEDGSIFYGGWARMAQPIINFAVVEVAKPNIGKWEVLVFGCFQWHYKDEVNIGGASWIVASLWPTARTVVMGLSWFSTWGN